MNDLASVEFLDEFQRPILSRGNVEHSGVSLQSRLDRESQAAILVDPEKISYLAIIPTPAFRVRFLDIPLDPKP
jgi:hypothetical protein